MISNIEFLTRLDSYQEPEAVMRDGVKVESILHRQYVIEFDMDGERWRFKAPAGYKYAPSIPPIARSFAPATGSAQWAAVPHDYGYQNNSLPRKVLDELYARIMVTLREKGRYRRRQYLAVRICGWIPWLKKGHKGGPTYKGFEKVDD